MSSESFHPEPLSIALLSSRELLEHHTPAGVTIDREWRVVATHGETGPFMVAATEPPTFELMAMLRGPLREVVSRAIGRAITEKRSVRVDDGWVDVDHGKRARFSVTASPLIVPGSKAIDPAASPEYIVLSFLTAGDVENDSLRAGTDTAAGSQLAEAIEKANLASEYAAKIVETLHEPVIVLNPDLSVRTANPAFYRDFKVHPEATIGRRIYDLGNGQWNIPALRTLLEEVLPANSTFDDFEVRHNFEGLGERVMLVNARRLDSVQLILLGIRDVTAQSNAERAVRLSEDRLRAALSIGTVGVIFWDKDLRVIQANEAFLKMSGLKLEEAIGKYWDELTPPEFFEASHRFLTEVKRGGEARPYEKQQLRKDGTRWWGLFAARKVGDEYVEYVIDITENKERDRRLREATARQAAAFAQAAVGLSEIDSEGRFLRVNPALCAMLAQPAEKLTDANVMEVTHADDRQATIDVIRRVLESGEPGTVDKRYLRPDGSIVFANSTATRLDGDGAGSPPTLLVVTVDLTERRRTEQRVRESEERFRLLVEGARDYAMIMQDTNGKITAWNSGAERMLGYSEEEAVGQFGGMIFTEEDRRVRAPEKELSAAAAEGRAEDERWHVRKDGTRFWGSGIQTALRNPDGSLRGFVKIMRDQTERKRTEQELHQAKESAEVSNRLKDDFLATLSHELRTPLSAIMIWTKLLLTPTIGREQMQEGLEAIVQSAESQKQLIDDLLDSSRITSGKLRLEMSDFKLDELVGSAVDAIEPTAEAKSIEIEREFVGNCGIVRADAERIRQIVWNLLTNAVKFTPGGGKIEVGCRRVDVHDVEIRVADTGRGIAPEFLPHVFERFSQSDPAMTRTSGGLGLGLAIVKQLVELHGGTIAAESEGQDKGATFRVTLPLRAVPSRMIKQRRASEPTPAPAVDTVRARLKGRRVLIVEDQPSARLAVRTLLESAGAIVSDAEDASEALQRFQSESIDVIISDIGLPGTDGYALIRQIREQQAAAGQEPTPAIALTAFAGQDDERAAKAAGFDRYLSKPFSVDMLLATVEELL